MFYLLAKKWFFPITYGRQYTHKYVYQPYRLSGNASTIRTLLAESPVVQRKR
jgi:hypothetical protein